MDLNDKTNRLLAVGCFLFYTFFYFLFYCGLIMNNTANRIVEAMSENDTKIAGRNLAVSMAKDGMSYKDAYLNIEHMKKVFDCAEKCLNRAALHELSKERRAIDPNHLNIGEY